MGGGYPVLSFGTYPCLLILVDFLCFCELGRTPTSLGLKGLALFKNIPCVDSVGQVTVTGGLAWAWASGGLGVHCVWATLEGLLEFEWALAVGSWCAL